MPSTRPTDDVPAGAAPAVVRAAAVLDALAASPAGWLTLTDLAKEVGIAKSSASSLCVALEASGMIRHDERGYALGRRLVELGGSYLARMDVVREFYDLCESSPVLGDQTVRLSALAGVDTLGLARYEGHPALRLTYGIGDRFPASATAQGKALLARLDDAEIVRLYHGISELPRVTADSLTQLDDLLQHVRRAREAGFGLDEQEAAEHVVGLAVATPTRGVRSPLLAVSATLLDTDASSERRAEFVAELRRFAQALGNPMAAI